MKYLAQITTPPSKQLIKADPNFLGQFIPKGTPGRAAVSGRTITVFGCTGFLGRYLVHQLAKSGSAVVVPYRAGSDDVRDLRVSGDLGRVTALRFDVRDDESLRQCMKHSDTVYNLVGRDYETRNFDFKAVHVTAAENIARIAKEVGVGRLIHLSCLGADPKETRSEVFRNKGEGELAVSSAYPDAVIVRPSQMYGWEDRLLRYLGTVVTHPVKRWATLGYIPLVNGGKREFNPVYVGDVAHALKNISDAEQPYKLYELYGPDRVSYDEFVRLFCEYARRPYFPLTVPHGPYRQIMGLLARVNPLNRYNEHDVDRQLVSDKLSSEAATFADTGIRPQSLESLLIRFVRHFRNEEHAEDPENFKGTQYWRQQKLLK